MTTIMLKYDTRNSVIKSILDAAIVAGAQIVESSSGTKRLSPIEKSLADVKAGRVTRVKNISNLLEECKK